MRPSPTVPLDRSKPSPSGPGPDLLLWWRRLRGLPGGRTLFSVALGFAVPYSGSIRATVMELEPGRARLELRDRRAVRNHLNSVHALALANLGELTSGLAMMGALAPGVRGIVTGIDVSYAKKARGRLVAECATDVPQVAGPLEHVVRAAITDRAGDRVAEVAVHWRLDRA